jgi:hypothetical protein
MTEPPETIEREVWATPAEFRRGLGLAFPNGVVERNNLLRVRDGETEMAIALEALSPRSIALLRMPRLKVSLRGTAGTREQFKAMVARMDLAMQRGGG